MLTLHTFILDNKQIFLPLRTLKKFKCQIKHLKVKYCQKEIN